MKLKLLIYKFINFWRSRVRSRDSEYEQRKREVIRMVVSLFPPDEPYVVGGEFSWFEVDGEHPPITLVMLERNLVISVFGPELGPWSERFLFCKNKASWEKVNKTANALILTCRELGVTHVPFYWDDYVSESSVKLLLDNFGLLE